MAESVRARWTADAPYVPNGMVSASLFGVRQAHLNGWVYRLAAIVVTDHGDMGTHQHVVSDILVYVEDGLIRSSNKPAYVDWDEQLIFDWVDLEPMLELAHVGEYTVEPMEAAEVEAAMDVWEDDVLDDSEDEEEPEWWSDDF